MTKVAHLLRLKGHDVYSIAPGESVYAALQLMAEKDVGALIVLEGNKLVGVMSERDYARKVILRGKASKETTVNDIMTPTPVWVDCSTSVEECMALMTGRRVRHLPVYDDDELIGVISIGDIVREMISERDFKIEQMEKYIQGRA